MIPESSLHDAFDPEAAVPAPTAAVLTYTDEDGEHTFKLEGLLHLPRPFPLADHLPRGPVHLSQTRPDPP